MSSLTLPVFLPPPSSTEGSPRQGDRRPQQQSAWLREMERASLDAWFTHAMVNTPGSDMTQALPHQRTQTVISDVQRHPMPAHETAISSEGVAARYAQRGNPGTHAKGDSEPIFAADVGRKMTDGAGISESQPPVSDGRPGEPSVTGQAMPLHQQAGTSPADVPAAEAGDSAISENHERRASVPPGGTGPVAAVPARLATGLTGYLDKIISASNAVHGTGHSAVVTHAPAVIDPGTPTAAFIVPGMAPTVRNAPGLHDIVDVATMTPPRPVAEKMPEQSPVRVHAQWSEEGVHLWLGLDAGVEKALAVLPKLLMEWFDKQGIRVLALVCNGRELSSRTSAIADASFSAHTGDLQSGCHTPARTGEPDRFMHRAAEADLVEFLKNRGQ